MLKVASLFSGLGGFEQGIYQALGKENVEIVFSSEIDKYAQKSYEILHNHKPSGDITKIDASLIPDFDLLTAGFPCQAFSVAGKRKGFEDTRGTLFFEVARILKEKRPKHFILENVKGLLSHDKGNTFEVIKQTLNSLGYTYHYKVLNSKYFNLPQNRERIFIIGSLEKDFDFEFPKQEKVSKAIKDILESDVDEKFFLSEEMQKKFIPKMEQKNSHTKDIICFNPKDLERNEQTKYQNRLYSSKGVATALTAGFSNSYKILVEGNLEGKFESTNRIYSISGISPTISVSGSDETKIIIEGYAGEYEHSGSLVMGVNGLSKCILGGNPAKFNKLSRIRKLTPLECFRIQGFPDEWYHTLKENGISNTQLYKMAGNAVSPPVIAEIVRNLYKE